MSRVTNVGIGLRNRAVSGCTVSGGSWLAALPAANVLDADRSLVARSTDDAATSTRIDFDFGQARELRAFALCNHNISQDGTWRVTLGTSSGASDVWDSAAQAAWYLPFDQPDEWETDNWWGLPADEYRGHPYSAWIVATQAYQARYMRIQVTDTTNPDTYVQIGRVWAGDLWQPALNAAVGIEHGWSDPSATERNRWGGVLADKRRRWRTVQLSYPLLEPTEADAVAEIQRRAGTVEELAFVPYPQDYQMQQRYGFVGRLAQMSPTRLLAYRLHTAALAFEEWV